MRFSLAAVARSPVTVEQREPSGAAAPGVRVSVEALVALEPAARGFGFIGRQPVRGLLAGRHGSRVRGRGLAFEELRQYLPGDDVRAIDWRVTARTGKPYIRVYTEEKDKPALIVVDQRVNMFFGSVRAMKSVAAAEVAALSAWRLVGQGDRVGGIVFDDRDIDEHRPHRSRAAVMTVLTAVAARNRALSAHGPNLRSPGRLDAALEAAANVATRDHLVVVISDFDGHGSHTRDLLIRLAAANRVVVVLVYDPFLLKLPRSGDLVVSDGELQVELRFGHAPTRRNLLDFADARAKEILGWQRAIGVTVVPVSAAEDVVTQVRHLLGQTAAQERRR